MNLGIKGRRSIVCASSRGLRRGCAEKLAEAGVHLTLTGPHETDPIESPVGNTARQQNISKAEARAGVVSAIPANQLGTAEEFGATCAFLCSVHAGFIVGQNILLDGGAFNSTMG